MHSTSLRILSLVALFLVAGCGSREATVIEGETVMTDEEIAEEEAGVGDMSEADDY
ncbi:MAG: hypothetical protein AAGD07_23690 [Planctomycetota bacterium]